MIKCLHKKLKFLKWKNFVFCEQLKNSTINSGKNVMLSHPYISQLIFLENTVKIHTQKKVWPQHS